MTQFPALEIDNKTKDAIIVLSHLRWDFVFQRPQQLMKRAAQSYNIFYVEEPIYEGNIFTFRHFRVEYGVHVIQPILPSSTPEFEATFYQGYIIHYITDSVINGRIILWYYTPMALKFGHRITADAIVFDKMDELSAFAFAPPALRTMEASLMDAADIVFTGGASLHAAAAGRNPNMHCFPSSIDAAHFGLARGGALLDPIDQAGLARPRLGFFGVIDERIDLQLIADVAALRPAWQLVMIGPTAKIDPATLPQASNIHWLGGRDYTQLPAYLAHWDLGWMPFARNEATRFISPTKTPEFLAAGLPLLSTPIHDVVEPYGRLGLVEIVSNAAAVVDAGDLMLAQARDPERVADRLAATDRQLMTGSWDTTWAAMQSLVEAVAFAASGAPQVAHAKESALV